MELKEITSSAHDTKYINIYKNNLKETIMATENMNLGIVNIKGMLDDLTAAIELGKEVSKDGITISDIFVTPKLIGLLIGGFTKYPQATKEFKDLSPEEILELVTYTGANILKVIFGTEFTAKVK